MFYEFTKPGSDEVLATVPFSNGYNVLARLYLSKGGNKNPSDSEVGLAGATIAASMAGVPGVELPDGNALDEETAAKLSILYDVELIGADDEPVSDEDVEENPTGTPGERS